MQIKRFSAFNYKSLREVTHVELTDGFNIITGQNGAGKTSLLELLSLSFQHRAYRSIPTVPNRGDRTNPESRISVVLEISNRELTGILRNNSQNRHFPLPEPPLYGNNQWQRSAIREFIEQFLRREKYMLEIEFMNGQPRLPGVVDQSLFYSYKMQTDASNRILAIPFALDFDNNLQVGDVFWMNSHQNSDDELSLNIALHLKQFLYRFGSERTVKARSGHGVSPELQANATNLAEVLNILGSNPVLFEEYVGLVNQVLPQVKWVDVRAVPEGHEVVVWSHDKKTRRDDLAVPLDETGSGVGQVLAILYVVVTSYDSKILIIDEPQSFLHPASAIKLIGILKRYPQHQFILATHSPAIIAAARPKNILALRHDGETKIEAFDLHKATSFNEFLAAAGLELQDVFGADNILWVEGPTEQQIFPEIIDVLTDIQLMGTMIRYVKATGDLEGRDAQRVFEIYRSLTSGNAVLPPVLAFILDPEMRGKQALDQLVKQSNGTARFLGRRMFENYLLHPDAVAAVMNDIEGFNPAVKPEDVTLKFEEKKKDHKYFKPAPISTDWVKDIHGSRLLSDIFGELSEQRVSYRKPDHSVLIARWLLANSPSELTEIAKILQEVFIPTKFNGKGEDSVTATRE